MIEAEVTSELKRIYLKMPLVSECAVIIYNGKILLECAHVHRR